MSGREGGGGLLEDTILIGILIGSRSQVGSAAFGTTRSPVAQIALALQQRESAALEHLQKPRPRRPRSEDIVGSTPRGGGAGDEHSPGSVAACAPTDGTISPTTRCADSAGASSMIESDSISVVSDAARGDKTVHEEDHSSTMPRSCLLWRSWHG